jgi:UDP-N-acetylglucosamine 4-epimerase
LNTIYNIAYGESTSLNELVAVLKEELGKFDTKILAVKPNYGAERLGDIPHSLASIEKAKKVLGYNPEFDIKTGLKNAIKWYYENLK